MIEAERLHANIVVEQNKISEGEQGLIDVARFVWRGRWKIAISIAGFLLLAILAILLISPKYRAEGTYQYVAEREQKGLFGLNSGALGALSATLGGGPATGQINAQGAIVAIRSRPFLIGFGEDEDLAPKLFPNRWDAEQQDWKSPDQQPTDWELSEKLKRLFSARLDSKTGLVLISTTWDDPQIAVDLLNRYVDRANQQFRSEANERTEARLEFLAEALRTTSIGEVKESIGDLIKAEVEQKMMISLEEEFAFRTISQPVRADDDEYVSPNISVLVASALVFGLFFGVLLAYASELRGKHRESTAGDRR